MMRYLVCFLLLLSVMSSVHADEEYKIEHVKGDVYRFINDRARSIFVITSEGVIVTDPMNRKAATWLKKEITKRFHKPITYVIYSHNHSDHIYGGEAFASPHTRFIAQQSAYQDITRTHAKTQVPDMYFKQQMFIAAGEHTIQLDYHGINDGRGSISLLVKPEKVMFAVDWIVLGRMPWHKLWSYDIQGMINSTSEVLNRDFDTFVGGHGKVGTKADVQRYLDYLNDLYDFVIEGINQGHSLLDIQKSAIPALAEYHDFDHYQKWLPENVEGVYERLMNESGMGWRPRD